MQEVTTKGTDIAVLALRAYDNFNEGNETNLDFDFSLIDKACARGGN